MKNLLVCLMFFFFFGVGIAQAVPMYYTFEGTPNETITTSTYTFVIDLDELDYSNPQWGSFSGWEEFSEDYSLVNYGYVFIDGIRKGWSELVDVNYNYPDDLGILMAFLKIGDFVAEDYGARFIYEFEVGDGLNIARDWSETWNSERNQHIVLTSITQYYPIPEPCTFFLLGSGLIGLAAFRKKCKKSYNPRFRKYLFR